MTTSSSKPRWIATLILLVLTTTVLMARWKSGNDDPSSSSRKDREVPVEIGEATRGLIEQHRKFTGSLEASARFVAAPRMAGRIRSLVADIGDTVERGMILATLDDAEVRQAVIEAEARHATAEARVAEARGRVAIARRNLERSRTLHQRGVASERTLDDARSEEIAAAAALEVAEAGVREAAAQLQSAEVRLSYTQVEAAWEQGDEQRVVAIRHADEGDMVSVNDAVFTVVELDPVLAVISVSEVDYPHVRVGQEATLAIDAFPGETFSGKINRVAPVFGNDSRQARIEIEVPNADQRLKPGMFARCTLVLQRVEEAVSVPVAAVMRQADGTGVFRLSDSGDSVIWTRVQPGIVDEERVQLIDADWTGSVVVLGQQFLQEGTRVTVANDATGEAP